MLIVKKNLNNAGETLEVWFDHNEWFIKKFRCGYELYYYIKDTKAEAMEMFNNIN